MQQNCYLIKENGFGILIDPGISTNEILKQTEDITINYILLTHCHYDHLFSLNKIRSGKKVVGTKECSFNMIRPDISLCDDTCLPDASCDIEMEDGEEKSFDGIKVLCIKTPGHTDGSCSFLIGGVLFSGDTIFYMSVGRWDLKTGNFYELINSVKNKIYKLPDDTVVYPGHGDKTTVGFEKINGYITE